MCLGLTLTLMLFEIPTSMFCEGLLCLLFLRVTHHIITMKRGRGRPETGGTLSPMMDSCTEAQLCNYELP